MIMALTMVLSAVSCGNSDIGSSGGNADNFTAAKSEEAEKSDDKTAPADTAGETAAAETSPETAAAAADEIGMNMEKAEAEDDGGDMRDYEAPTMWGDAAAEPVKARGADGMASAKGADIAFEGGMGGDAGGATADGAMYGGVADIDGAPTAMADDTLKVTDSPDIPDVPDDTSEPDPDPEPDPEPDLPEAGLLTAGEWNDNDNWGFFSNLVNAGTISFPVFSLDPTTRVAVKVKNADGKPAVNAKVKLLDEDGKVIWNAVSDKQGMAYLFATSKSVPVTIEAELDGDKQTTDYKAPEKDEQGNKKASNSSTEIVLEGTSKLYKDTEIMFIVDTTGSMSDEMLFLQSEFSAIAREVGSDNVKYAVSFYRDEGDDYVTKHNDFTSDVSSLQKALNNETADGGGDFPEAVAQILTETITDGKWSKESVKLAFLIFDAPPHAGTEKELMAAAKAAGEKGIRIVPIVSSGSDRETELFARSLAIMSGGTYVFLTDDSGIGGGHLEPIIGDYKVEKLYDIIIRVIDTYKQ